jgi:hypothetical protein
MQILLHLSKTFAVAGYKYVHFLRNSNTLSRNETVLDCEGTSLCSLVLHFCLRYGAFCVMQSR